MKVPNTPAIRALKSAKVDYKLHKYKYEEKGGTANSAQELGISEHQVIKTITLITNESEVIIMLQHGDEEISTKELARQIGAKSVNLCDAKMAEKSTGYIFGGTSPFGTRKKLRTFAESSIFSLDKIYINAGKQGLLVELKPDDILKIISIEKISAKA